MRYSLTSLLLVVTLAPVQAADFGSIEVGDKGKKALSHACAIQPRFAAAGFGKSEAVLLFSDLPLDCAALVDRINPESGAFEQVVEGNSGVLLSVSFQDGLKPGRVSVYGPGFTLGGDPCAGCTLAASHAGTGIQGSALTGEPLTLSDMAIRFDVRFDLPKPQAPAAGEALPGGGEPGKAYQAYLKAFQDGDYAALQRLMPDGEAKDDFGFYGDADAIASAIREEEKPRTMTILKANRFGDAAILIVEVPHPWTEGEQTKAGVGLVHDGNGWRVREERIDVVGGMFGDQ